MSCLPPGAQRACPLQIACSPQRLRARRRGSGPHRSSARVALRGERSIDQRKVDGIEKTQRLANLPA
jgi:hypothetical protein